MCLLIQFLQLEKLILLVRGGNLDKQVKKLKK